MEICCIYCRNFAIFYYRSASCISGEGLADGVGEDVIEGDAEGCDTEVLAGSGVFGLGNKNHVPIPAIMLTALISARVPLFISLLLACIIDNYIL